MSTSTTKTAHIKNRYLRLLDSFRAEAQQTEEQQRLQALALITQAFEDREYIHMPVRGERGSRQPMDDAFTTIQANHQAIEAALAALTADVNSLEDAMVFNGDELTTLLDILRTEITVRALNTAGQEQYERQISESFLYPLTLAPASETDLTPSATQVSWEPNDPNSLMWVGDLSDALETPIQDELSSLLYGQEIEVQVVAWSNSVSLGDDLIAALSTELAGLTNGQPLDLNDFFIITGVGVDSTPTLNPDGSGFLTIELSVPALLSHIQLTTHPENTIDYVMIINHQGVPTMYQMLDTHVFIRPTVVQKIQFHVTGGAPGQSLDTFFSAIVNYGDVSGGSPHITGYFADRVSSTLLDEPVRLTSPKTAATVARKKQLEALTKAKIEAATIKSTGLKSDKAKDMLSTSTSTAKDTKVPASTPEQLAALQDVGALTPPAQPATSTPSTSAPPSSSDREPAEDEAMTAAASNTSAPTVPVSHPREDRESRPAPPSPEDAVPTSTPPGQAHQEAAMDSEITEGGDNTPSSTHPAEGSPHHGQEEEDGPVG